MRVLLLGGNGFLGSHVKDRLVADGHAVRALDRAPERFRPDPPDVEHVYGDLGNELRLDEAFAGVDVVFHLAWTTVPKTAEDDPAFDVESNLVQLANVLKSAVRHSVRHLVFFSSGGTVYGRSDAERILESHPTNPISAYGATKLAAEKYVHVAAHRHGLRSTIVRPSNPYGPRQDPRAVQGAIAVFTHAALTGAPIQIWGDGAVVRDYVHVHDFASAAVAALERSGDTTEVVNVGSGEGVDVNTLVAAIGDAVGVTPEVTHTPGRPVDVPRNVLDIRRARELLGWQPSTPLATGLAETAAWMRDALEREES